MGRSRGEVARVERERDKRLSDKDSVIIKMRTWNERAQKTFSKIVKSRTL